MFLIFLVVIITIVMLFSVYIIYINSKHKNKIISFEEVNKMIISDLKEMTEERNSLSNSCKEHVERFIEQNVLIDRLQKKEHELNEEISNLRNHIISLEQQLLLEKKNESATEMTEIEKSNSEEIVIVENSDNQKPSPEKVDETELILEQEIIPVKSQNEKTKKKKSKKK